MDSKDIFNTEKYDLGNNNFLYIIEIEKIEGKLKDFIDEKLISICYGPRKIDFKTVKKKILKFLLKKSKIENGIKDNTILMGSISEFMIHLFLNSCNYKQEFIFKNLEEDSIKKGFDGYYSFEEISWIMESKSGSINTKDNTHKSKIKDAYTSIDNMLNGKTKNSPWENAYNHSKITNSKKSISEKLNQLDINYMNEKYEKIKDHNIITASTIIYDKKWDQRKNENFDTINKLIETFNYKQINVICLNKKSLSNFRKYLEN